MLLSTTYSPLFPVDIVTTESKLKNELHVDGTLMPFADYRELLKGCCCCCCRPNDGDGFT